jgi:putative transposase
MRCPASEKLEIISIVEQSHLPTKITLDKLGVARRTFYRWYDHYLKGGPEALADRPSSPRRVRNRIPKVIHNQIIDLAPEQPGLSPRKLAVRFTDERRYFVSEAKVYRLLKAHDLITSPAYVVVKAANEFHTKTVRPNEMWQTDFTYFKIIGWGWMYLSTVLDDFSRYIIAWRLCSNMRAEDVTDTLDMALAASGCDHATVQHKPRLPSDLERQIEAFVEHYSHQRYHESLNNVTPADAYFGRAQAIIQQREKIKRQTIEYRRLQHRKLAP